VLLKSNFRDDTIDWKLNFLNYLKEINISFKIENKDDYYTIVLLDYKFIVNLLDINSTLNPNKLRKLQAIYFAQDIKLVHLWQDVWLTKPAQVIARIKSLTRQNIRIHGRKTKVIKIEKPIADEFLNQNHLQGSVSSRHKYGLYLNTELIAVATFSALRKMKNLDEYYSAELIRFAVKDGFSIAGGLSKLIKAFIDYKKPNDIMTYADMDWSIGESYLKLGFEFINQVKENYFYLDENLNRKIAISVNAETNVFNTGSLKFILKL
jgi:hypothetical protein